MVQQYHIYTYKDRLTSYNGTAITYDDLGNPLSYLGKTLTWNGRELATLITGGVTSTYKYDTNGIRYSKTVGGVTTEYLYSGGYLIIEKRGNDTIWYQYNQNGMTGFELNGTAYYYVRNLLGDVTKIITSSGTVVASYTYDAWGICTIGTNTNNIATINPIRYRGYYYDSESSLYYLNSRYYDPEVGRFISTDNINVAVSVGEYNLYAYCINDPIKYIDSLGFYSQENRKIDFWSTLVSYIDFTSAGALLIAAGVATNLGRSNILSSITAFAPKVAKTMQVIGYVAVAFSAVDNMITNIKNNETTTRVVTDMIVDVGVGVGIIWASGAIGAALGSGIPLIGNAVGAIIGVGVGLFMYFEGDEIVAQIKNEVYNTVVTIDNWVENKTKNIENWFKNLFN